MFPNIFNLPPFFQNLYGLGDQNGGTPTYTASGGIYNGPFKNDTATPFRTVEGIGQYGSGLNSSAAQMYDYFRRDGKAADRGLPFGGAVQTIDDFLNRRNPKPIETPLPPDTNPDGGDAGGIPPFKFPTSSGGIFNNGFQGIFNLNPEQLARISQGTAGGFKR